MFRTVPACFGLLLVSVALTPAFAGDGATPIPFASPVATPIPIKTGGKYVLTRNLTATGPGPVLDISVPSGPAATPVDIDLNGFVLAGSPGFPVISAAGSILPPALMTVKIHDGSLEGGTSGIFVMTGLHVIIEDVAVGDTSGFGIHLTDVRSFAIRRSVVARTGANAIAVDGSLIKEGTIEDSLVKDAAGGIYVTDGSSVAILNNRVESIAAGPLPGGIIVADTDDCLVSNNTIENVRGPGGKGIHVINTHGCKFYNNVIAKVHDEGILLDYRSFDDLVLNNVVIHAGFEGTPPVPVAPFDGILVEGPPSDLPSARGHHIDRNVLNRNARHGLHFGSGAWDNNFGRNTALGNLGPPCVSHPAGPSLDFCDENGIIGTTAADNFSFGDNLMPGRLGLF